MSTAALSRLPSLSLTALAAASWGLVPVLVRQADAARPSHPLAQAFVVLSIVAVASAPWTLGGIASFSLRKPTRRLWAALLWLGVAEAVNVVLLFAAYRTTSIAAANVAHHVSPLFVAVAAPVVLGERSSSRAKLAASAGLVGVALIARPWNASAGDLAGIGLALVAAVFFASSVVVSKVLGRWLSPLPLMGARATGAAVLVATVAPSGTVAAPFRAIAGGFSAVAATNSVDPGWSLAALGWLAAAALGPALTGGLLFLRGLRGVSASHAATLTLLEPIVAAALGASVLGESSSASAVVGGVLVLVSAWAVFRDVPGQARDAGAITAHDSIGRNEQW